MLAALLQQTKNNRKVICISGRIAQGKTIAMSVLANSIRDLYNSSVYSNYSLTNGKPLEEITNREQMKIVCIDEFELVWQGSTQYIYDLMADKEQNTIFLFVAFLPDRLPPEVRKMIDFTLEVQKIDFNTIKIQGVNNHYEHEIYILNECHSYNAFEPPKIHY